MRRTATSPSRACSTSPESVLLEGWQRSLRVSSLLDTGATLVSVPAHLADELNLQAGAPQPSLTTNGTVITRATRVDALAFGPFDLRNVPANLKPGMADYQVLLGMSALRHLECTQRSDTLVLRSLSGA